MILSSFLDFSSKYFLKIGDFGITWYATCILTGIILATIMGVKEAKRFNISAGTIIDGVLICVPLSILGARIYYILFALDEFIVKGNPGETFLRMIGFTNGHFELSGLSITGGVIVAIIFVIVYAKIKKISVFAVFDLLAPGLLIGQICGRWGNFFNQEAHGGVISPDTLEVLQHIIPSFIMDKMHYYDPNLGMTAWWHPTFLYESLWNLLGLIIILVCRRKLKQMRLGDTVCFYLIWYGIGRSCLIEPFRMDPLMMGSIRINVLVPALFAVAGLTWMILKHTCLKQPYYIEFQKELHKNDCNTVIVKVEGALTNVRPLLKNAFYYTLLEYRKKNTVDEELTKLIKLNPKEFFNEEEYNYFKKYINENMNQLVLTKKAKNFFKMLYTNDIDAVLVSKYDLDFIKNVCDMLNITRYTSIYMEETNLATAIQKFNDRKIMVITDSKADLELAKEHNLDNVLVRYSNEYQQALSVEPTHIIDRFDDMFEIIIR